MPSGSSATAPATCARCPASARPRSNCRHSASRFPARGPGAALTTAATVDTWDRAFAISRDTWGGRRTVRAVPRAIAYAHEGFPVTPSQHFWQNFRAEELGGWPGFAQTFMPDGAIPAIGTTLRQPQLGRSLERIATPWRARVL